MRILIVEDEPKMARLLQRTLVEDHQAVDLATDGEEGLYKARSTQYDLVVLDVLLPKRDGFQVLAELRAARIDTRVLMLTARGGVEDRVRGLEAGADDYLAKPFALAEFSARVQAQLRRIGEALPTQLVLADLVLDARRHRVTRGGALLHLTAKEFGLLEYLLRNAGEVVPRTRLVEHVWDENFDPFSNTWTSPCTGCARKWMAGAGQL
jgi:two-component system copper resistance phosphate regulon response regulator CusR